MKTNNKPVRNETTKGSNGDCPKDEIARCAYLIWEHEGKPEGRDIEFWMEAEMQVQQARELKTAAE